MGAVLATGVESLRRSSPALMCLRRSVGCSRSVRRFGHGLRPCNNLRGPIWAEVDKRCYRAERALRRHRRGCCLREGGSRCRSFRCRLAALAARAPIDAFFEDVLIMDDDLALRENRLRLLNRFVAVFAHVADFGKMAKGAKEPMDEFIAYEAPPSCPRST
ncbi:MAG: hypothetical protein ACLSVD_11955 [Eggerthellaceae bacterium]